MTQLKDNENEDWGQLNRGISRDWFSVGVCSCVSVCFMCGHSKYMGIVVDVVVVVVVCG